jgi:hypothetical protein
MPGHYILLACGHILPAMAWNGPPEVTDPAYYPASADISSAQTIDLQNGQDFLADFHLRSERGYRVVVPFSRGSSNGVVTISVRNSGGQIIPFSGVHYDLKQGQIIAPALPSGAWTLQATAAGGREGPLTAGEEITVDHSNLIAPPIVLHPGLSIPLIVNHSSAGGSSNSPVFDRIGNRNGAPAPIFTATLISETGGTASRVQRLRWHRSRQV